MVSTADRIKDIGPQPQSFDIEHATKENTHYRSVAWSGRYLQVTLMSRCRRRKRRLKPTTRQARGLVSAAKACPRSTRVTARNSKTFGIPCGGRSGSTRLSLAASHASTIRLTRCGKTPNVLWNRDTPGVTLVKH